MYVGGEGGLSKLVLIQIIQVSSGFVTVQQSQSKHTWLEEYKLEL